MCGLDGNLVEQAKIRSHLTAVYQYNLRHDLSAHANPQRPSYALGNDGGLLLCTWPRGNKLTIPFIYSNEVWTGIEYQVASHLMLEGMVEKGLEIVRLCRDRYDGTRRNPFNEYECGHWYARALSSYGLLQGLTGVRYDAVDRTLHVRSQVGDDFRSFFAWDGGFGTVGLKKGKPFLDIKSGTIDIEKVVVTDETGAATSPWKTTPPSLAERRARAEQLQPRLMALRDQFEAHVFDAGAGESIPYRLFQPRETVPQAKYPLIIYLHGSVGRGSDNLKQISGGNLYGARIWAPPEEQAQRPCFILAPQLMQGVGGQREMAAQGEKLGDEQDDAGLAGRWKQVTDSPAGELVMELTLHKQGPDYRGELRVPRQGTLAVEEVSYRNGTLTYKTVGPLPLRAEFLVAGRRFKGTLATFGEEERARRLLALIRSVVETRAIDKDRIYITGQSMGGGGTWGMIAFSPATFAAAVPVCGPCSVTTAPKIVEHGVAVWAFHGAADPTVPVRASRDMIEALRAAGGNKAQAARLLGITRAGLYKRLKRLGVPSP